MTTLIANDSSARCASCSMHRFCLPAGLDRSDMQKFDSIIVRRRKVEKGETVFRIGVPFTRLYAVRLGHFKSFQISPAGDQHVTGFYMGGDLLGMDAISAERHHAVVQAIEDAELCEIPYAGLEGVLTRAPSLLRHFHRLLSREITREQATMMLLGSMTASQRLASFLLNLASRYEARGYSSSAMNLRMSREDIGNFLGLTIESVSRGFKKLAQARVIDVDNRSIRVLDAVQLRRVAVAEPEPAKAGS